MPFASDYYGAHHQPALDVRKNDTFRERCADLILQFRVIREERPGYWIVQFEHYIDARVPGNKKPGSYEHRYTRDILVAQLAA